ncbi:MAG: hypothetical protein ACYC0X_26125 [Pirellulaceae bacterium]
MAIRILITDDVATTRDDSNAGFSHAEGQAVSRASKGVETIDLTHTQSNHTIDDRFPIRPMAGGRVRIAAGALDGMQGTVLNREYSGRALLVSDSLPDGIFIEIDDYTLEPIEDGR